MSLEERVTHLEIEIGKTTVVNENIHRRLTHLDALLATNQKMLVQIDAQLKIREERIKVLKAFLTGLIAITTAISGFHLKEIIARLLS